jgi:hypothetical protein
MCQTENDCGDGFCCLGTCCPPGDVCPAAGISWEVSVASVGCCTPFGCPQDLGIGDQCGSGLLDENCGTVIPVECDCAGGLDCYESHCCVPLQGDCSSDSDCCGAAPYCTNGICSTCLGEGGACSANTGDCCSGLRCNGLECISCAGENEPCTDPEECCPPFTCHLGDGQCIRN